MKTDRFQIEVILIKDILVHEELDPSNSKELINFLKKVKLSVIRLLWLLLEEKISSTRWYEPNSFF